MCGAAFSTLPPRVAIVCWSRSLTAVRRSASARGGRRLAARQAGRRVVTPKERTRETGQTRGMDREQALRTERVWAGVALNEAMAISGWHHHGAHESVIYVVTGSVRLECGPGGR